MIYGPPPKQHLYTKVQERQAHERPTEGVIISVKPNKDVITVIEGRSTKVQKFGNSGETRGSFPFCHQRTVERKDNNGSDSDVDDWHERKGAKEFRNLINQVALSRPNK